MKKTLHLVIIKIQVESENKVAAAALVGSLIGQGMNYVTDIAVSDAQTVEVPDES